MRLNKLTVSVLIGVVALLVAGTALAVAGGLPARSGPDVQPVAVSPQDSGDEPTETPLPTPTATPAPVIKQAAEQPLISIGPVDETEIAAQPKSAIKPPLAGETKGGTDSGVQVRGESSQPETESGTSGSTVISEGTVFSWNDGDREMWAVLQNDVPEPDSGAASAKGDSDTARSSQSGSKSGSASKNGSDAAVLPVFRSESGGGEMTLPGGVILLLDETWDDAAVESFLSANKIEADTLTEIEFLKNAYVVESDPGFPSLDLANSLHGQNGVVASSPNWSRERVAK